ncbi:MAG: DUF2231 domain-containing protein [Leptospirales bacterium]
MSSPFLLHPMLVHMALSLGLLAAAGEIFPRLRERISTPLLRGLWAATLAAFLLAALAGILSLERITGQKIPIPGEASLHRLIALSAIGIFFILGLLRLLPEGRSFSLPLALRRILALSALVLLLSAAALGGHLVYDDRLGTAFMTQGPPHLPKNP